MASRVLERVEAALQPNDVGLAENRGLDRVGRLVDERRRLERERTAAGLELPQRVSKPRVDDESPLGDPPLDLVVRDDLRLVVVRRSCPLSSASNICAW